METALRIAQHFTTPTELGIAWSDGAESYVKYTKLRDHCPCAKCEGEPDVMGRVVKPVNLTIPQPSYYELHSLEFIGSYAIKFRWKDGHDTGIYSYDLLKKLGS